jgi:hypothetical protein
MTRKDIRNTTVLRGIAPFIAVLTVMIALAALAQTRAGQAFGKSHAALVSPGVSTTLLKQDSPVLPGGINAEHSSAGPTRGSSFVGPLVPVPPVFVPAVTYGSGGAGAQSLAVADVNGDGVPDLAIANFYANTIGILLGNSDGTFQGAVTYGSGGYGTSAVAVADVNGDGKPDLLVANECATPFSSGTCSSDGSLGVLLGNGDGTFKPAVSYDPGRPGTNSIAVADVDVDGKPDVVVGNFNDSVGVLLGNGDGSFQLGAIYSSQAEFSVAVADVNGDGKPDLLVANLYNNVAVLLGNGDGTFQPAVVYAPGGFDASSVIARDVNGDGKPDLLVTNWFVNNQNFKADGVIGVLLGNGDGTFQAAVPYDSGGQGTTSIAVADVNGDGKPDLVVGSCSFSGGSDNCSPGPGVVGVLLGNGDGTFRSAATYSSGGSMAQSVAIADVNGDGKPDLLVANLCTNSCPDATGDVGVLLNGHATKTTLVSSLNPSFYGQVVTFTAKVTSAAGTPTGIVVFFDGSTTLGSATLASGKASVSTSLLAAGLHSITAQYQGLGTFAPSMSAKVSQAVKSATTTTSLASSQNPAVITEFVTYTATVTSQYGGAATGTVAFQDGGVTVATVTLASNQAAYRTKYISSGAHSIAATYSGDTSNTGSLSATLVEQINLGFASKMVLTTSGSPSFVGQAVTFTATVTSGHGTIPDGELVTFFDGKAAIGTGTTASSVATFTTSSLRVKTHTIKATYGGDAIFRPSSGTVTQIVNKYPTTTSLTSSPDPSAHGQAVTFTATVTSTGPTPTGTVKFMDGTTNLGTVTLSGGIAKLTTSTLAVGTHPITAQYLGDSASSTSTSSVVNQVVH